MSTITTPPTLHITCGYFGVKLCCTLYISKYGTVWHTNSKYGQVWHTKHEMVSFYQEKWKQGEEWGQDDTDNDLLILMMISLQESSPKAEEVERVDQRPNDSRNLPERTGFVLVGGLPHHAVASNCSQRHLVFLVSWASAYQWPHGPMSNSRPAQGPCASNDPSTAATYHHASVDTEAYWSIFPEIQNISGLMVHCVSALKAMAIHSQVKRPPSHPCQFWRSYWSQSGLFLKDVESAFLSFYLCTVLFIQIYGTRMYIDIYIYSIILYIVVWIYLYWCIDCIFAKAKRHATTQPQLLPTESVPESSTQPQGDEIKPRTEWKMQFPSWEDTGNDA